MMMMMIMIAGYVDSVTTPIKSWLETVVNSDDDDRQKTNSNMMRVRVRVKEVGVDRVDCIVCLSEVSLGEKFAMLERCKHGFHVECVEAWLKDHPNCPLCRASVSVPVSGSGDHTQNHHRVYLNKIYETMGGYGIRALESMAGWVTKSFSQGLQSTLSDSCNYL